ncbi:hypothetical protein N2152v2_009631 [Parachlorella kessleri]
MGVDASSHSKRKAEQGAQHNMDPLLHAAAGAVAGCISRFVVGPLDVLKIRFQVQIEPIAANPATHSKYTGVGQALATIFKEEGIKGLWRGTVPGQLLTIPYTAVQFVTLQHCKRLAEQWGVSAHPQWRHSVSFVSGALAGAAGTVASYPFDLLRTTLAAQGEPKVYADMTEAARGIVRQHGVKGLYRGLGVTVIEIMPYAALQFGLYDALMKFYSQVRCALLHESPEAPPSGFQSFMCGLAAGTLAKLGSHPLDVAKKRYQVAGLARSARYGQRIPEEVCRSLPALIRDIYRREGLRGLYKGALPSIIKAAPAAAVTFAAYEVVLRAMAQRQPGQAGLPRQGQQDLLPQKQQQQKAWQRQHVQQLGGGGGGSSLGGGTGGRVEELSGQ